MPLLDHFHPPLFPSRPWESFHARWANSIGDQLNRMLPPRYVSDIFAHLGAEVAADVIEVEKRQGESGNGAAGGTVALREWAPPAAVLCLPAIFPDEMEVRVTDQTDDARLVAVIELVSPRNKDRPEARRAFAAKCAAYLQYGVGLVVADLVTTRLANLHDELITLLSLPANLRMPGSEGPYVVSYRPVHRQGRDEIDVWPERVPLGRALPTVPLALRGAGLLPLDLEESYTDACTRARL